MAIDVVKLYEEVQKENKGTGVTAEVTKHVMTIKNELKKAGVKEVGRVSGRGEEEYGERD